MKECLEDGIGLLELHPQFLKNTAYISRFVKLFRSQFRSFPILQFMRKIMLAIEKIHSNNAREAISSVLSGFPIHLGTGFDLELPSRQYFEYCLAKVLAHAQIMLRLVVCSKKCALYFVHFLQQGHFIEVSTMTIGLLGHVWQQARQSLLRMDPFYKQLMAFRSQFPSKKSAEQIDDSFPTTLLDLIGDDWKKEVDVLVDDETSTLFTTTEALHPIVNENDQPIEEYTQTPRKVQCHKIITPKEEDHDIGEAISRGPPKPKGIPEVLGKRTLIHFLKTENEMRSKRSNKSLTKGISQFHWEKFRQLMEGKMRIPNVNIKDVFDKEWVHFRK